MRLGGSGLGLVDSRGGSKPHTYVRTRLHTYVFVFGVRRFCRNFRLKQSRQDLLGHNPVYRLSTFPLFGLPTFCYIWQAVRMAADSSDDKKEFMEPEPEPNTIINKTCWLCAAKIYQKCPMCKMRICKDCYRVWGRDHLTRCQETHAEPHRLEGGRADPEDEPAVE